MDEAEDLAAHIHALERMLQEDLWKEDLIHSAKDKRAAVSAAIKALRGKKA
jgi:hypothetical protein